MSGGDTAEAARAEAAEDARKRGVARPLAARTCPEHGARVVARLIPPVPGSGARRALTGYFCPVCARQV